LKQPFVAGSFQTPMGSIPQVSSSLVWADHLGTFKARWGIKRMDYTVEPGLYALGNPNNQSPALVTANYKMSFDRLREALPHRDMWILVLDTRGINVWCSAGKGTFGTSELVNRIQSTGLAKVVSHRELILPQLAGPGVAAHEVKKLSGFKVIYGPIRSKDLPAFRKWAQSYPRDEAQNVYGTGTNRFIPIELCFSHERGVIVLLLFLISFPWKNWGRLQMLSSWFILSGGDSDCNPGGCSFYTIAVTLVARSGFFSERA
jgi:acetyl-CoA decarbonylase/synthase complex subunit gamma